MSSEIWGGGEKKISLKELSAHHTLKVNTAHGHWLLLFSLPPLPERPFSLPHVQLWLMPSKTHVHSNNTDFLVPTMCQAVLEYGTTRARQSSVLLDLTKDKKQINI